MRVDSDDLRNQDVAAYNGSIRPIVRRLNVTRRAMKRAMLGVSLRARIRNDEICKITTVIDIARRIADLKCQWAGHIARSSNIDRVLGDAALVGAPQGGPTIW
jgi:hypothetical protein